MAIYTPQQLVSASNATYTTNGVGNITGATVRTLNTDWISSSVLVDANNRITGSQFLSGSLRITNNTTNQTALVITGSGGAGVTIDKRSYNAIGYREPGLDVYSQIFSSDTATAGQYIGAIKPDFTVDVEHALVVTTSSITFNDFDAVTVGNYIPYMTIAPNLGNNPTPQMVRGLGVTGSVGITEALKLKPQNPLPSGTVGDLAVSGSSLYFYNGAWTLVV